MSLSEQSNLTGERILEVDLGTRLGVVSFSTAEELQQWVTLEYSYWQWLNAPISKMKLLRLVLNRQLYRQTEIDSAFAEINQRLSDLEFVKQKASHIGSYLRERYVDQKALHASMPEAILAGGQEDQLIGGGVMLGFLGIEVPTPQSLIPQLQEGLWLAFAFKHNVHGKLESNTQSFDELFSSIQRTHEGQSKTAGMLMDRFKNLSEEISSTKKRQDSEYLEERKSRQELFDALIKNSEDRLEAMSKTVRNDLALQGPVEYFESKASDHKWLAIAFSIASFLVMFAVGVGAWLAVRPILVAAIQGPAASRFPVSDVSRIVEAGLILFLTSLGIWCARILIRLTLGNIHLHTDFRIRGMLVKAYLALLTSDKALKDDDRELVLRILFRPTSDGIVRDDAAPTTPAELLSRLFSKQN